MKSEISLLVENDDRTFTSGDTIKGLVKLSVLKEIDIKEIVVSLEGSDHIRYVKWDKIDNINNIHERKTSLLRVPIRLCFPLEETQSSSITLPVGEYQYPFSLEIPFANTADIGSLPPSFLYNGSSLAKVNYEVSAVVKTVKFFLSNPHQCKPIKFVPPNASLPYDRDHVLDGSGFLLPSTGGNINRVKYESISLASRSLWKRALASNTTKIPLEFIMEFNQNDSLPSPSSRVIVMNNSLALSFGLSILCPFNNDALRKILFNNDNCELKNDTLPDRASILLTHIQILLRGTLADSADPKFTLTYTKRVLVDRPLDNELEFSDFETTPYYQPNGRLKVFDLVKPKQGHLIDNQTVYKIPLQSLWFDGAISDDLVSSFMSPNIDHCYNLKVRLSVKSLPGNRSDTLECSSNVVLIRNEQPQFDSSPPSGQPPPYPA